MNDHYRKLINFVYEKIKHIKEPTLLELEVREGVSTKMFIELCEAQSGNLYSIDTNNCKSVSKSKRWNFIQSRDDNFDLEFSFVSTGFALAKKLNNNELNSPKKIPSRKLGVKNLVRKILK